MLHLFSLDLHEDKHLMLVVTTWWLRCDGKVERRRLSRILFIVFFLGFVVAEKEQRRKKKEDVKERWGGFGWGFIPTWEDLFVIYFTYLLFLFSFFLKVKVSKKKVSNILLYTCAGSACTPCSDELR